VREVGRAGINDGVQPIVNRHGAEHRPACLPHQRGAAGEGFAGVADVIGQQHPQMVGLEVLERFRPVFLASVRHRHHINSQARSSHRR
jgi:hypothetical protein